MKLLTTEQESLIVKLIMVFSCTCVYRFAGAATRYGDLRISGGGSSGRLQFRLDDGTWGYVCSRGFDSDAASVACRQLGYASGTDYYRYYYYYNHHNNYATCYTYCYGHENRLTDCSMGICSQFSYLNYCDSAVIINCYGQNTGFDSSSDGGGGDGDNHVYPGVIVAVLLVLIAAVLIMGIGIIIKKKKSIRRSQKTAKVAVIKSPQFSVIHYAHPSVSSQVPVSNQSYPNPVYAQQQTPQTSTDSEAAITSVSPQAAAFYPSYGDAEDAAVGFTSDQLALLDGNNRHGNNIFT